MQAEKVSGELRDAAEAIGGNSAPMSAIASVLRRLERRRAQAPDLLAPVVNTLDTALSAFDAARQALDEALRVAGDNPG